MLFFLALHDVVYPDTLEPIVAAGELLAFAELEARFAGGHGMDNVITHVIHAQSRAEALKIVADLVDQM